MLSFANAQIIEGNDIKRNSTKYWLYYFLKQNFLSTNARAMVPSPFRVFEGRINGKHVSCPFNSCQITFHRNGISIQIRIYHNTMCCKNEFRYIQVGFETNMCSILGEKCNLATNRMVLYKNTWHIHIHICSHETWKVFNLWAASITGMAHAWTEVT